MTIGEALKRERESLGLTQEEMTKNIIQKSHYSKIERNIEGISADSLFKILFTHHIDVDEFLESIKDTYTSKEDVKAGLLEKRMMNAFNTSNTEAVKKCLAEILELDENLIFKYRALIAVATFDGNLDQLSENTRKNIVKKFNDFNNWVENIDSLRLLANCMSVFTQAQLDNNIDYLLNYYRKKDDHPEIKIERVAIICNN
ncbi:helix-turn-helix domain-containing protein [Lactobacillus taiwanensis]|nr:helix-turn-helix transcriptional regulator [Lactobacillus taiwanensis]